MAARLLITGGSGFIGGAIVRAALDCGLDVRVFDTRPPGPEQGFSDEVEFVRGDVRDPDALTAALAGCDAVCHQAAKVGLETDIADAPEYVSVNSLGTATLLAAMAKQRVARLVLASSMVVYGEGLYSDGDTLMTAPPRDPAALERGEFEPVAASGRALTPQLIAEDRPLDPRNVYAATKLEQEHLARSWARVTGGTAALLRYHNVYGPLMPNGTPYAGVASLFRSALERGEAPRVFEDGGQRRDFVHVADVARANLAALEWTGAAPTQAVRAFNVASGEVHTILDLATELSRARSGPDPVVTGEFRAGDVRHITASASRIRDELRWRPQVSFADGVAAFAIEPMQAAEGAP